ncbi:glycosyltransferase [Chitinibacteraceae bacterium HSL-7]
MSTDVQILVSTMRSRAALNAALFATPGCGYLVIDQLPATEADWPAGVTVIPCNETGLSKSRNVALAHASADIAVIADDDVRHAPELVSVLVDALASSGADFVTFDLIGHAAGRAREHTARSVLQVSSCRIAFRPAAFHQAGIRFDTRFGLGAAFASGEENIWLSDALAAGLRGVHVPAALVEHDGPSTGYRFDEKLAESKGALQLRLFGWRGWLTMWAFALKKHALYREQMGLMRFMRAQWRGARAFLRTEHQDD